MANEANIKAVITADDRASAALKRFSNNIESTSQKGQASFVKMGTVIGGVAGIVSNLANRAMNSLADSIGTAVKRVDTLDNANRTFQNMGFSAKDTTANMDLLKKSILGLPTSLDAAVRNVELLASSTNDIGKSRKIFSALNDGILGFGGTAEQVDTAVVQLSQAFAGGRVMAQDWNSMLNAGLGPALNAIAKKMGTTTQALKEGLSDGSISVKDFQDQLIELDEKGGGGLVSLQKIAGDSTHGIGTGIENAKTAIARGIADILKSIGTANISNAIATIGSSFEDLLSKIADFTTKGIAYIQQFVNYVTPGFNSLVSTVKNVSRIFTESFLPSLEALYRTFVERLVPQVKALYDALEPGLTQALKLLAKLIVIDVVANLWVFINVWNILLSVLGFITRVISDVIKWFGNLGGSIVNAVKGIPDFISNVFKDLGSILLAPFKWAFQEIKKGIQDVKDTFNNVKDSITSAPGKAASRVGSWLNPFRAEGGPVSSGNPYIVGEKGPELFVPGRSGTIVANDKMGSGGAASNINISVNAGVFMGSDVEARKAAETILMHMKQLAGSKNMTLQDYIA